MKCECVKFTKLRDCTEGPITEAELQCGGALVPFTTEHPEGPQFSGMLRPVCAAMLHSTADCDW